MENGEGWYLVLGAHVDSPQEFPLLLVEDAVNLTHGRKIQFICAPMTTTGKLVEAIKWPNIMKDNLDHKC